MMTSPVLYCHCKGIRSSRAVERADLVAGDGTKVKASASKASSRTLEELDVSIGELQKALEAEASAWWRQAELLDGQEDGEPDEADAARDVRPAAGARKRTADRLARPMDQAAVVCAARAEQERAAAAPQRALAGPNKGNGPQGQHH